MYAYIYALDCVRASLTPVVAVCLFVYSSTMFSSETRRRESDSSPTTPFHLAHACDCTGRYCMYSPYTLPPVCGASRDVNYLHPCQLGSGKGKGEASRFSPFVWGYAFDESNYCVGGQEMRWVLHWDLSEEQKDDHEQRRIRSSSSWACGRGRLGHEKYRISAHSKELTVNVTSNPVCVALPMSSAE